jgi:hypothetical protein
VKTAPSRTARIVAATEPLRATNSCHHADG